MPQHQARRNGDVRQNKKRKRNRQDFSDTTDTAEGSNLDTSNSPKTRDPNQARNSDDDEDDNNPVENFRALLREKRESKRDYRRQVKNTVYDEETGPQLARLQLECRFNFLSFFSNKFSDYLIRIIYGVDIDEYSHMYDVAYRRIQGHCKNWKTMALKKGEMHVKEMMKLDNAGDMALTHLTTHEALGSYYFSKFSPDNFTYVFAWLHQFLDVKGSTPLGIAFMKNVYANLMAEMTQYIRWQEDGKVGDEHDRTALMQVFDDLGTREEWSEVDVNCFKRRRRNESKRTLTKRKGPSRVVIYGTVPLAD